MYTSQRSRDSSERRIDAKHRSVGPIFLGKSQVNTLAFTLLGLVVWLLEGREAGWTPTMHVAMVPERQPGYQPESGGGHPASW